MNTCRHALCYCQYATNNGECVRSSDSCPYLHIKPSKPVTISDKLKSLPDDELAKALCEIWFDEWPNGGFCPKEECPEPWDSCVSCIAAWLKREVKV